MKLSRGRNVFVNCPFDEGYAPLLQSILFTVVDCGFNPRCALERSDSGEIRIQKIYRIIEDCDLGVHDLSRTQLDSNTGLPRFNMPLELGIFLGAKFLGTEENQQKMCLVFDEKPYRYQMYLSDVAGQDIQWHCNDPKALAFRVRDWLASVAQDPLPSGSIVWDHYLTFQGELRHNCEQVKQRPAELTYNEILRHIVAFRAEYKETLDIQGDRNISNPQPWQIRDAIKSVSSPDPYIILGKGANGFTYVQAYLEGTDSWRMEFQAGHRDQHYEGADTVDTSRVIEIFLAFARCDEIWRKSVNWRHLEY